MAESTAYIWILCLILGLALVTAVAFFTKKCYQQRQKSRHSLRLRITLNERLLGYRKICLD